MDTLSPEQLSDQAKKAYQDGNYDKAAQGFAAASQAYKTQDKPLLAAEMANNQSVAHLQASDPQAALDAVEGTQHIFQQADDKLKFAMALGNRAAALDALDQFEQAQKDYLQSAELLNTLREDQLHAQVMQSLSAMQLRSGRQLEALSTMQSGISGIKRPSIRQRLLKKLLDLPGKFLNR